VLAEVEAANLGVLLGRDHAGSPRTRDGCASAVEEARRFPGRRPCIATRPPRARSARTPSPCPRPVCRARPPAGKSDPSRGPDTRVDDRDGQDALPGSGDVAGAPPGPTLGVPRCDTPASSTRAHDHTRGRSQRGRCSAGRFSDEAACPRGRSGRALRLDTVVKPWHKRDDRLGRRRSIEVVTEGLEVSAPGPHLIRRSAQRTPPPRDRSNPGGLWTLTRLWTHRSRPQPLGNLAEEREIPTSVHSPLFFSFFQEKIKTGSTPVQIDAVSDDR